MKYLVTLLLILGFGLSAFGQTIKSLGYNTTNGQVVYGGTNALTFTNGIRLGLNPTNVPSVGQVVMQQAATNVASEVTMWSSDQTTSASFLFKKQNLQTNWSIVSWGNNIKINSNNEHTIRDASQPASYWSIENNYDSSANAPQYGSSISETYFTTVTSNGFNDVRGFAVVGNHKNPTNGIIISAYPNFIQSSPTRRLFGTNGNFWDAFYALTVIDDSDSAGFGAIFLNRSTNTNATIRTDWAMTGQFSSDVFWIRKRINRVELRQNNDGFTAMSSTTNGVLIGGADNSNASSRVHLGGNTLIDGAISFNATSNAATTRTNLGIGNGITATNTFVSYNGTNYTTNTVTISNGIITGWTQ